MTSGIGLAAWNATGVITTATTPIMGSINRYNAGSGNLNIALPALAGRIVGSGTILEKVTLDASANTVTFSRAGSDTFDDGTTSVVLTSPGQQIQLQVVLISSVKHWKVIGSGINGNSVAGTLNVKAFGAVGDGTTDDSAAFLAAYAAAVSNSVSSYSFGGQRTTHVIDVPAGTYLLTQNGSLIADLAITVTAGITFRGDANEATKIVFNPANANGFLATNQSDLYFTTWEDISFWCTGTNAATATFLKSYDTGGNRLHRFNRCLWGGTWKYGLDLTGISANNDTFSWADCTIKGNWTSFLHVPGTLGAGVGDNILFFTFLNPTVEMTTGDFLDMAYGGEILILGGTFVHEGDGTETTSTAQCFFKLGLGASPVGTHSAGAQNFTMIGGRVEHRHQHSSLIRTDWSGGNITFTGLISDPFQYILSTPTAVMQAEFGSAALVAVNPGRPNILFQNCLLMGYHKYHYGPASYQDRANFKYDTCSIVTFLRAVDFIVYADDSSLGLIVGRAPVRFEDCHSILAQDDTKEVFDCTVGFPNVGAVSIQRKVVPIQWPWGGTAYNSNPVLINLPLNAIITRVFAIKAASGTSTSTAVTYTLTDANAATIATVTSGGAAWNAGWQYDSGMLANSCTTDNKRKLTLTAAGIAETPADCLIFVEYLA